MTDTVLCHKGSSMRKGIYVRVLQRLMSVLTLFGFLQSKEDDALDADFEGDGKTLYHFSVSGMNAAGDEVTLDIKAYNSRHASSQMRSREYFPTSVRLKETAGNGVESAGAM